MISSLNTLFLVAGLCYAIVSAYEYEAVYHIENITETYSINLGKGTETALKFIFVITDEGTSHGIEEVEGIAEAKESGAATALVPNVAAVTMVNGTLYQATLDADNWMSTFNIKFAATGYYAFFAEHDIEEFHIEGAMSEYIMKDEEGHDIAPDYPTSTTTTTVEEAKNWAGTMLGCLVVWATTFSGLVLVVLGLNKVYAAWKHHILMFSSGTLLCTAFALVLFEATHLVGTDGSEGLASGRWTSMTLLGFITSPLVRLFLGVMAPEYMIVMDAAEKDDEAAGNSSTAVELTNASSADPDNNALEKPGAEKPDAEMGINSKENMNCSESDFSIFMPLILGDFFHNFCDGIFIGTAFKCSPTFAWKIVGITVAHELPQEIADFAILTGKLNYSVFWALLYNMVSGMSVMLGGLTIMLAETSDLAVGMLLAYGAGNYIYIATIHLFGYENAKYADRLLAFIVGCIAIGLILLDHEHCELTSTTADAHAGHGH